jgi:hypothetical protein
MITLETLYKGQETEIKGKKYLKTERYLKPFIEKLKDIAEFEFYAKSPDQITGEAVTYNKLLAVAKLKDQWEDYNLAVCFSYALDSKKPVAKFFKCLVKDGQVMVYDPRAIIYQAIEPEELLSYSCIKELLERTDDFTVINSLNNANISKSDAFRVIGKMITLNYYAFMSSDFGKVKLSKSTPNEAYEELYLNAESKFYSEDDTISYFDFLEVYNSLIADDNKDIVNKFEKSAIALQLVNESRK